MHRKSDTPNPARRSLLGGLAALPLLSLSAPALAQVGRTYRIELVIFEHASEESRRLQQEIAAVREPSFGGSTLDGRNYQTADFELHRAVERVENSGTGRVLARLAWEQIGRDHASTPWLRVQEGRRLGWRRDTLEEGRDALQPVVLEDELYELEGRLRVWVGRYLHLETDLIYHVDTGIRSAETPPAIAVQGHQRMNSGDQLFYLDHPVIGIIARVTRAD